MVKFNFIILMLVLIIVPTTLAYDNVNYSVQIISIGEPSISVTSNANYTSSIVVDGIYGIINNTNYTMFVGSMPYLLDVPPIIDTISIEPTTPNEKDDLIGFCNFTTFENIDYDIYYRWYKNDVLLSENTTLLNESNFISSDNIIFSCMAIDNRSFPSIWYNSTSVYIDRFSWINSTGLSIGKIYKLPASWGTSDGRLAYSTIAGDDITVNTINNSIWYQIAFDEVGAEYLMNGSTTSDDILVTKNGTYDVSIQASLHSSTVENFEIKLCKNNCVTDLFFAKFYITSLTSNNIISSSARTLDSLYVDDTIEAWVKCTSDDGIDVVFDQVNIVVNMVDD